MFFVGFLITGSGCTNKSSDVVDGSVNSPDNAPVSDAITGNVVRSFSVSQISSGETVTVTLTKKLNDGQKTVLIEENFPSGWEVVDAGTGVAKGNAIKWAELLNANSGTLEYTLKSSSDSGAWSGEYSINGAPPVSIEGYSIIG